MKHKVTQLERVKKILMEQGTISRNYCLDTRLTTRLSEYIRALREEGWNIDTDEKTTKSDTLYHVKNMPYKKVEYFVPAINKTIIKYEKIPTHQTQA